MTIVITRIPVLREQATAFVLSETGVSADDLAGPCRKAHLVAARALFVWIVKTIGPEYLGDSEIGTWLGGRDRSTIRDLFHVVAARLRDRDEAFAALCVHATYHFHGEPACQ